MGLFNHHKGVVRPEAKWDYIVSLSVLSKGFHRYEKY